MTALNEEPKVYVYVARRFYRRRVTRLLYAMERGCIGERKWGWSSYRRVFNFSGEQAALAVARLNNVYPAHKIIEV